MVYVRGQAHDYDRWGGPEWSWEQCLPFFKQHERHHRVAGQVNFGKPAWLSTCSTQKAFFLKKKKYDQPTTKTDVPGHVAAVHGGSGEWHVNKISSEWPVLHAFHDAAVQAGIPATDDFNTGNNTGVGFVYSFCELREGVQHP